jgi:hypothetical protein
VLRRPSTIGGSCSAAPEPTGPRRGGGLVAAAEGRDHGVLLARPEVGVEGR